MAEVFKFLNTQITLPATANTVYGQKLVRLTGSAAVGTNRTVTQKDANSVTLSSFILLGQTSVVVEKAASDTLQIDTGTDVLAVPVAYRN
jgi:hypothetical protein